MSEAIDRSLFLEYFQTFTSFNGSKFDEILIHLHKYATKYGLIEDDMSLVATVSFRQHLGNMRVRKVLKCLVPRRYCSKIAVNIILKQIVKYKDGSVLRVKQYLQWLIGVIEYNLVDTIEDINIYYHLFVYLLNIELIDVSAAKLVYFLTTPDDVSRPFTKRVLRLYNAINKGGRHFVALLYLFKCYRPDVVPEKIPVISAQNAFGDASKGIFENLLRAQKRIAKTHDLEHNIWNKFGLEYIINKRTNKIILVPDISVKNVIKKSHTFNSSSNETSCVLSLLNNRAGMHRIAVGPKILHERLSYQLYFVLYDAFLDRNPNVTRAERDKILQNVASLQNILQQPIPVVSKFIGQYLMRWDGYEHQNHIYNIMEWMHVRSFTEFRHCVLSYLLHLFYTSTVRTKCRILFCLGNFTVNIISTYVQREIIGIPSKYFDVKQQFSFPQFIKELFVFLQNLCLTGIYMEENHPAVLNTVLIIHEDILVAGERAGINFKISKSIPYAALFFHMPNALNAVCRLINEFPKCVSQNVKKDFIDCLWNNNAFMPNTNKGSIFCNFDKNKYSIAHLEERLHLKTHYAFLCYTYLINMETSPEEAERILNNMKRRYSDIFRFLKKYA